MSNDKSPSVVRELTPSPKNPRRISEKRSAQLAKSMARFGDLSSITFNRRSGHLVSGHQRAKHLQPNAKITITENRVEDGVGVVAIGHIVSGDKRWPYRVVDWDEETEAAALIAANAHGGAFEDVGLSQLVKGLDLKGFDMDLLGLDNLEDILEGKDEVAGAADSAPGVASGKATAKRGDVWILGDHRLMCGDSTNRQDVETLMGAERAHLVFTDPPYGVDDKSEGHDFDIIKGDDKRDDGLYQMVCGALKQAVAFAVDAAAFYVWHASSTRREFEDAMRDAGLSERQYLIWVKNAIVLGRADYHWAHEPCFYAAKTGHKPAWHGDRAQPTVWRATLKKREGLATTLGQAIVLSDGAGGTMAITPGLPKAKKHRSIRLEPGKPVWIETSSDCADVFEVGRDHDYVHPTQKPVELATVAIKNSTKPGEIVLDLFGGSGTTLMGAEATGRYARLMELDPKYVDAIVKRWEEATERTAVKE